ncbi:MAG: GtrA family protein [Novosphingobium sp.]
MSREVRGQILRYGVSGLVLAVLYSVVYWILATRLGISPFAANSAAFLCNLVAGWWFHSRWSFRGFGPSGQPAAAYARFFVVNGIGYGLNSVWVWIIVYRLGGAVELPIVPIVTITPALCFILNRLWIFNRAI